MVRILKESNLGKVVEKHTYELNSMGFKDVKNKSTKIANKDISILEGTIPDTMSGKVILHIDKNSGKVINSIIMGNIDLNRNNEKALRQFIFDYGDIN